MRLSGCNRMVQIIGMSKLDLLKAELETLEDFKCLGITLADRIKNYYENEIERIEQFGAENPMVEVDEAYMHRLKRFNRDYTLTVSNTNNKQSLVYKT